MKFKIGYYIKDRKNNLLVLFEANSKDIRQM